MPGNKPKPFSDADVIINLAETEQAVCLQCFDAVGWAAGRASGL